DHPDAAGRRAVRATLPSDAVEEPWAAADVVLTLDDRGEVARIAVEPEPGRPPFEVELDIVAVGGPQTVVPPEIGQAAHRGVPLDAVAAAGIEAVELGQVPSGWVLSQAWAFDLAPQCTALSLGYVDAVTSGGAPGSLRLTMTTEACAPVLNAVTVVSRPEPLAVGPFTGTIGEQGASTTGWLSDGVTAVTFDTDLPAEDVTALLSSLRPFDTRSEPDPVDGITSS
ncbi:MAG TPA: hypothetical protein VE575_16445, partial [Acidimicrobiales bacterium]|nr:hypothetical protein [Acidimicrobiales bacterium]